MGEIEKTCENCEYELEDTEGTHCRHCIHNAEEKFKQKAYYEKKIECMDDVIERLLYKANNIKAKLEPSYFTECIDYLKTLPRVEEEQEIRNKAIDEFAEKFKQDILERIYDISERQRNYKVGGEMSTMHSHVMGTLWGIHNTTIDEIAEKMKGE